MPRNYSSKRSIAARKTVAAQLPAPCFRCGRIVTADMKWEADHPLSRVQAEALGIPEHEQDAGVVPAHASCNHRAGAVVGNQIKAQAKAKPRIVPQVSRPQLSGFSGEGFNTPAAAPQILSPEAVSDGR